MKGELASDGAGPRRNGRGTCNRHAKATHSVAYCDTIWRTCRRRHVGHATTVASMSLTRKVWPLQCHQNGRLLQQGRSDTAGVNRSQAWVTERVQPNLGLRHHDTASLDSKKCAPEVRSHPT